MQIPSINPVGIAEYPKGYASSPRAYPTGLRVAALLILAAFVTVSAATTVYSLGVYCLTSYATVPFVLGP